MIDVTHHIPLVLISIVFADSAAVTVRHFHTPHGNQFVAECAQCVVVCLDTGYLSPGTVLATAGISGGTGGECIVG
jgi:hypothetical protein